MLNRYFNFCKFDLKLFFINDFKSVFFYLFLRYIVIYDVVWVFYRRNGDNFNCILIENIVYFYIIWIYRSVCVMSEKKWCYVNI